MAATSVLNSATSTKYGDLDITTARNMKLFYTVDGLTNGYTGQLAALHSRMMLVAEAWDSADFSIISEEAKALRLSPKGELSRNVMLRDTELINKENARIARIWRNTAGDDSESKKIESGGAEPEVYAKAKIIVEGVIADAELSGNTAKKIKYQTVRLAIGYMSTGGLVSNGYGGKSESPDAHSEAIRILKELME
jgi:hypothetical protein